MTARPGIGVPGLMSSRLDQASEGTGERMTTSDNSTKDDEARAAAVELLRQGLASPSEVAHLAGVSRQLVGHWAKEINWRKARAATLAKAWRKATGRR